MKAVKSPLAPEKSSISGQVDKKTQRVAWKVGTNNTLIEAGRQKLTRDVASCLVHFGRDQTQTWLLVRLNQPEMPTGPQTASGGYERIFITAPRVFAIGWKLLHCCTYQRCLVTSTETDFFTGSVQIDKLTKARY